MERSTERRTNREIQTNLKASGFGCLCFLATAVWNGGASRFVDLILVLSVVLFVFVLCFFRERERVELLHACILIKRSGLCLTRNRIFVNSSRARSTSALSYGIPASGSNSQCCRPTWLLTLYSHGPPSAIFSFHIFFTHIYIRCQHQPNNLVINYHARV